VERDQLVVAIADTGAGIPERIQARIFDPFFTTKEVGRGSGQGLSISRAIVVDKHRGSLDFVTRPGEGTTFFVRLPLDLARPVSPEQAA
jgi:signal transduction histidine kinase